MALPYLFFVFSYLGLRVVSFFVSTTDSAFVETSLMALLLGIFAWICAKRPGMGLVLLVSELILGGAGHFLELEGISMRSWLLGIFGICWIVHVMKSRSLAFLRMPRTLGMLFVLTCAFVGLAAARGLAAGHGLSLVFQDLILYMFLLLVFPMRMYMNALVKHSAALLLAFVSASSAFVLLTFARHSASIGLVHDYYYDWFRNVVGGKITDLGLGFFRIVTSDQLWLVPIMMILFAYLVHKKGNRILWIAAGLGTLLLLINMTRIYILACVIGALFLALGASKKRWFTVSATLSIIAIAIFTGLSFVASSGQSMGLEHIGLKANSLTNPTADVSAATRLLIWPEAKSLIAAHPFVGSGLATQVSFTDPATNQQITRTQFDMGYVEMLTELGGIGFGIYMLFLCILGYMLYTVAKRSREESDATLHARALLAGLIGLSVVNLTTPALFQGFGVVYIAFALAWVLQKNTLSNNI